jgi:hypothetical protein
MNSNDRPFQQLRAAAIRAGTLLDITETARMTEFGMPASMTPKLWRAIANEDPFHPNDPRVMSLCWCLFLMLLAKGYAREHIGPWSRTVWFKGMILGRKVAVKAVAHGGDHFEPVMTLMTPEEGCDFVQ